MSTALYMSIVPTGSYITMVMLRLANADLVVGTPINTISCELLLLGAATVVCIHRCYSNVVTVVL